jgi:hypothetical protein
MEKGGDENCECVVRKASVHTRGTADQKLKNNAKKEE